LCSDYLVRFQKRLPRDLQAKYDAADVVHDVIALPCRDLQQFDGVTDEKLCQWKRVAGPRQPRTETANDSA
jgi:hypothetical protein